MGIGRTTPINNWTSEVGYGPVKPMPPIPVNMSGGLINMMSVMAAF
ncbi:MAG: hypothetical protein CM1200mP24_07840 [Gammaproteobacteria bacterium]|nr:MAG: hypothetical protein CM1200mP24_07840 [Gammaproteobacteria bacterium]